MPMGSAYRSAGFEAKGKGGECEIEGRTILEASCANLPCELPSRRYFGSKRTSSNVDSFLELAGNSPSETPSFFIHAGSTVEISNLTLLNTELLNSSTGLFPLGNLLVEGRLTLRDVKVDLSLSRLRQQQGELCKSNKSWNESQITSNTIMVPYFTSDYLTLENVEFMTSESTGNTPAPCLTLEVTTDFARLTSKDTFHLKENGSLGFSGLRLVNIDNVSMTEGTLGSLKVFMMTEPNKGSKNDCSVNCLWVSDCELEVPPDELALLNNWFSISITGDGGSNSTRAQEDWFTKHLPFGEVQSLPGGPGLRLQRLVSRLDSTHSSWLYTNVTLLPSTQLSDPPLDVLWMDTEPQPPPLGAYTLISSKLYLLDFDAVPPRLAVDPQGLEPEQLYRRSHLLLDRHTELNTDVRRGDRLPTIQVPTLILGEYWTGEEQVLDLAGLSSPSNEDKPYDGQDMLHFRYLTIAGLQSLMGHPNSNLRISEDVTRQSDRDEFSSGPDYGSSGPGGRGKRRALTLAELQLRGKLVMDVIWVVSDKDALSSG
eukprot:gene17609-23942_t